MRKQRREGKEGQIHVDETGRGLLCFHLGTGHQIRETKGGKKKVVHREKGVDGPSGRGGCRVDGGV